MREDEPFEVLFLGCGGSMGVPMVGCHCDVCTSGDPYNERMRSSILISKGNKKVLVDAGPDFRSQALIHGIDKIDGAIITHAHHDHTGGIDDLRVFPIFSKKPLPCLMMHPTYDELKERYSYMFKGPFLPPQNFQRFDVELIPNGRGYHNFVGVDFQYLTFTQVGMDILGLRFGDIAYITDIEKYPDTIYEDLKGVKILIVSALRFTKSPMHFTVDEAVAFAEKVGAEKTYLTHLAHELDYHKVNAYLPSSIRMAYDGLIL